MIQVGKKLGNQPLDDAIMEHLRMKRISPEDAYDKALDQKKITGPSCPTRRKTTKHVTPQLQPCGSAPELQIIS